MEFLRGEDRGNRLAGYWFLVAGCWLGKSLFIYNQSGQSHLILKYFSAKRNPMSQFIHHVYFWLNNPGSEQDKKNLIEGLQKLSKVKTIRSFYIGVPADTRREVIDSSYSVSWLLFFDNAVDQDSYQADPIHLNFVKECKHLWQKVIVYDTVSAV
jgi:hypothetical protein